MKKFLLIFVLFSSNCFAQFVRQYNSSSAASGGCANNTSWIDTTAHTQAFCDNGVWRTLIPITTGTGFTAGSILFAGSTGLFSQDNANLFWNNTTKQFGIGTNTPGDVFEVRGLYPSFIVSSTVDIDKYGLSQMSLRLFNSVFNATSEEIWSFGAEGSLADNGTVTGSDFYFYDSTLGHNKFILKSGGSTAFGYNITSGATLAGASLIIDSSNNIGIGVIVPAIKLDIAGAIRSTLTVITFSATPTFDVSLGNSFTFTLTGNVTSSIISNAQTGEQISFKLCQDHTGGWSFVWPGNVIFTTITPTLLPDKCSMLLALYDGTNWLIR